MLHILLVYLLIPRIGHVGGNTHEIKKNHVDPTRADSRDVDRAFAGGLFRRVGLSKTKRNPMFCVCVNSTKHGPLAIAIRNPRWRGVRVRALAMVGGRVRGGFFTSHEPSMCLPSVRAVGSRAIRLDADSARRRSTRLDSPTRRPIDRCFRVRFRRRDRGRRTSSSVGRRASSLDDDAFSREKEGAKEGRKDASSSNATDGSRDAVGDG